MKLTRRQEDVIRKMLDLFRELQGPIHYSTLAEYLGVSPFTAYDMLRLLEEKGLVTSEYQLAADKSGPGRAVRVFLPSQKTLEDADLIRDQIGGMDWEAVKQNVLDKLRKGEVYDRELADEVLARIPSAGRGQLRYCVEVMTVIVLRIQSKAGRQALSGLLPQFLPENRAASRTDLSLLGGIALGILALEDEGDLEWKAQLLEHVQIYMDIVISLDVDKCRSLGDHLKNVFTLLGESGKSANHKSRRSSPPEDH